MHVYYIISRYILLLPSLLLVVRLSSFIGCKCNITHRILAKHNATDTQRQRSTQKNQKQQRHETATTIKFV